MADTQHNLKIKATLDTSQVQHEADKLNAADGRAGMAGSSNSTARLLNKLDSTLNKLNATISRLAEVVRRPLASDNAGYILAAKSFSQMTDKEFAGAIKKIDKHRPDIMAKAGASADLTETELQVLQLRGIISDSTAAKIRAAKKAQKAQALNPPIVSQNVMRVFPDGTYQLMDRDEAPQQNASQREPSVNNASKQKSWYRQVRLGWGLNMAGQMFGESAGLMNADEATQRSWQGVGNVISTAGMATMVHPIVGAFAFVATSALELAKSLKAAEEQVKVYAQRRSEAVDVARGGLNLYTAEKGVLGSTDYERLVEKARENLLVDTEKRADAYRELIEIQGQPYSRENAEAVERTKDYIKVLDNNIKENESIVEAAKRRREVLDEEVLAGQRLAQAERDFSRSLEEAEYQRRRDWSEYNTSNIQANREALRSYRQQLTSARASQMMAVFSTGIESQLGQIHTNTFTGNKDPTYWFKLAREQRNYIGQFQQLALGTGDLQKMAEYMRQAGEASQKFQGFMQMAQALKLMQIGQPVDRVDLQGLTSLAGRGGWMGEQYRQPEYMSTLEKMYDTLKSIDDNTRAAEKSVWQ